jgi:hypothetical protein
MLTPGQWILVEARQRTHDTGDLWLGKTMPNSNWGRGGPCVWPAEKEMAKGQKGKQLHKIMFNRKDYMIAVQWYENVPDDEEERLYVRESPDIFVMNSSELRLAAFEMEQVSGARPLNMRARRGAQADELEGILETQKWRIPVEVKQRACAACRGVMREAAP